MIITLTRVHVVPQSLMEFHACGSYEERLLEKSGELFLISSQTGICIPFKHLYYFQMCVSVSDMASWFNWKLKAHFKRACEHHGLWIRSSWTFTWEVVRVIIVSFFCFRCLPVINIFINAILILIISEPMTVYVSVVCRDVLFASHGNWSK